jgi:hypothetical protein
MSWYGAHPTMSKEAARALLPPGACKLCVYIRRVFHVPFDRSKCQRCGLPADAQAKVYWKTPNGLYRCTVTDRLKDKLRGRMVY